MDAPRRASGFPYLKPASLVLGYFACGIARQMLGPLSAYIVRDLGATYLGIGMLNGAFAFGYISVAFPWRRLGDTFNPGAVLVYGQMIIALAVALCYWVRSALAFGFLFFVAGMAFGFVPSATVKTIVASFPGTLRATMIGLTEMAIPAGWALYTLVVPIVDHVFGWQFIFLCVSLLVLFSACVALVVQRATILERGKTGGRNAARVRRPRNLSRNLVLTDIVGGIHMAAQFSLFSYLLLFLMRHGISIGQGMICLVFLQVGGLLGRVGWTALCDKYARVRLSTVIKLVGVVSAVFCAALARVPDALRLPRVVLLCLICGLAVVGWSGIVQAFRARLAGEDLVGEATAQGMSVAFLGALVGPPCFGLLVERLSFDYAWMACSLLLLLNVAIVTAIHTEGGDDEWTVQD